VWLAEKKIDVACIQESKLRAEDGVIKVRGYDVVRKDRLRSDGSGSRGGGLVCLVRNDWGYRVVEAEVDANCGVEMMCVDVLDRQKRVWKVRNVYVPPVNSREVTLSEVERCICDESRWIVCGDWNAHDGSWDPFVAGDERGAWLVEWFEERDLHVMNDGSGTREERGTGRLSVPDVTAVSRMLADDCSWQVVPGFLSDHLPIILSVGAGDPERRREVKRLMWDWNKADWDGYKSWLVNMAERVEWDSLSMKEMEAKIRELILRSAKRYVGRKRVDVGESVSMSNSAREAAAERDRLRAEGADWEVVKSAGDRVNEELRTKRREIRGRVVVRCGRF